MCTPARDLDTRTDIHFGEPHLLPCQHLWMDHRCECVFQCSLQANRLSSQQLSIPINEITHLEKRMTAFVIPNGIQITTRQAKYTFASFLSRDTTYDVIYNIWKLERPDDSSITSGQRGSFERGLEQVAGGDLNGINEGVGPLVRKQTQCACGREGKHFSETALETVLPGTPDKIHNLIFTSGFIKEFMAVDQKLIGVLLS